MSITGIADPGRMNRGAHAQGPCLARYRRSVPVTTMSTSPLPRREQTSHSRQTALDTQAVTRATSRLRVLLPPEQTSSALSET